MPTRSCHVLAVDDEPAALRFYEQVLKGAGHRCTLAPDARAAIESARAQRFDLAVTDLRMPGSDEMQYLGALGEAAPEMPIVVVTGHPTLATALFAIRSSVVDYLVKPVRAAALLAAVERAAERAHLAVRIRSLRQDLEAQERTLRELEKAIAAGGPRQQEAEPPREARHEPATLDRATLSRREREILDRFAGGERLPEIAGALGISPNTARNHMKSIFAKLGVRSQLELAVRLSGQKPS